jgi:hypothetical protein
MANRQPKAVKVPPPARPVSGKAVAADLLAALDAPSRSSVDPSPLIGSGGTAPEDPSYPMTDSDEDYEEDGDADRYDTSAMQAKGTRLPEWACKPNLTVELERQQSIDPDTIFPRFEPTCDLMAMFDKKKRPFQTRGESGHWGGDALTKDEDENYRKQAGFH